MKNIYKFMVPLLLMIMMLPLIEGSLDSQWRCPISGTSETTTLYKYLSYQDQVPYGDCQKAGNNFTIEFRLTGDADDFTATEGASIDFSATLYIYKGSDVKFTLPLNGNFTNTSATQTDLVRFTDFGELYTTGITGSPKWVNNLTFSDYKYYIGIQNVTPVIGVDVLTSEPGMYSGDMVQVTFKHPQSKGAYMAEAAMAGVPGTEEVQSMLGLKKVVTREGAEDLIPVIIVIIIVALLFFSKKKTR